MDRGAFVFSDVADQVVSCLCGGTSVNLVGLRSSGRSTVLDQVCTMLAAEGLTPLRIVGVSALRDRPLTALTMAGVEWPTARIGPGTFAEAARALERMLSARPSVVVVDDADDIDPASAGLLMAVRARMPLPVVVSSRPASRRQLAANPLVTELLPAARVAIPPLGYGPVLQVVQSVLPGPVERATTARIAAISGGLPGVVTALVKCGRRAGTLVQEDGTWVARGDLWKPALVQTVEPLLADLDEAGLDALVKVASSGAVELRRVTEFVPWEMLALLDDLGLLQVTAGSKPMVGVYPPVLARFLTHGGSRVRSWRARHELGSGRSPRPQDEELLRPWESAFPDRSALPVFDRRFAQHWRSELAVRQEEWNVRPVPATAVALVTALSNLDAPAWAVDEVLAGTRQDADDPRSTALLRVALVQDVGLRRRDPDRALVLLDQEPAPTGYRGLYRAIRAHLALIDGRAPAPRDLESDEQDAPLARDAVRAVRLEYDLSCGRAVPPAGRVDDTPRDATAFARGITLNRALALVLDAQIAAGTAEALDRLDEARDRLDPGSVRAYAYAAVLGLILDRRPTAAEELLSQVLTMPSRDLTAGHFEDGLLVLAAMVAALRGYPRRAAALAGQAVRLGAPRGPVPGMWPGAAVALVGRTSRGAGSVLWQLADELLAAGFLPAAVAAGVDAMERDPHPLRAQPLIAATAQVGGGLVRAHREYLLALGSDDPAGLAVVAERLRDQGLHLYATRAVLARALRLRASGDAGTAAALAQAEWAEVESHQDQVRGLFAPLARQVDLSARELDIVARIGQGLPSSAVAVALGLSVRTVDNHIQNALRKTGLDNRAALVLAARTWARPPAANDVVGLDRVDRSEDDRQEDDRREGGLAGQWLSELVPRA